MASLIGFGSHGQDIEAIYRRCERNSLAIYDEDPESGMLPPPKNLKGRILIGINSPRTRREVAERFPKCKGTHPLVDPTVVMGPDVTLGRGTVVAPGTVLLRSVTLGAHVHTNYLTSMTRCIVGDFTTISPGAVICGDVTIGEECWIGAGAVICDRSNIGHGVVIGAGAVVPPQSRVYDGARVIGVWKG